MHIHIKYIYTQYAQTHRRKSFPLRSTVDARIHRHTHTGFRRRPATQELPLTQHGRRTDSRGARNIPMPLTATRQQPNVATSVLFMFLLICLHGRYWHVNINKKIDRSIYK